MDSNFDDFEDFDLSRVKNERAPTPVEIIDEEALTRRRVTRKGDKPGPQKVSNDESPVIKIKEEVVVKEEPSSPVDNEQMLESFVQELFQGAKARGQWDPFPVIKTEVETKKEKDDDNGEISTSNLDNCEIPVIEEEAEAEAENHVRKKETVALGSEMSGTVDTAPETSAGRIELNSSLEEGDTSLATAKGDEGGMRLRNGTIIKRKKDEQRKAPSGPQRKKASNSKEHSMIRTKSSLKQGDSLVITAQRDEGRMRLRSRQHPQFKTKKEEHQMNTADGGNKSGQRKRLNKKEAKVPPKNKCTVCGNSYSRRGYLRLHQRIRTEEKPCKC